MNDFLILVPIGCGSISSAIRDNLVLNWLGPSQLSENRTDLVLFLLDRSPFGTDLDSNLLSNRCNQSVVVVVTATLGE